VTLNTTSLRVFSWGFAATLFAAALGVLAFAPFEHLTRPGWRNWGYVIAGIAELFGEFGARLFFALCLLGLSMLFAWLPLRAGRAELTRRSTPTPRKRGAG
jgi:hypothetical protein